MEKTSKKERSSIIKGKAAMLLPFDDTKVVASKKAKAETIQSTAATVTGKERWLLPPLPDVDPFFPPALEHASQDSGSSTSRKRKYKEEVDSISWLDLKVAMKPNSFHFVNNCLAGYKAVVSEFDEPLAEKETDRDRMMKLSAFVMTEIDDKLKVAEQNKKKLKEYEKLMDNVKMDREALVEAVKIKDQALEKIKRQDEEIKKLRKKLEVATLERDSALAETSKGRDSFFHELDSALAEVSKLKESLSAVKETAFQEFLRTRDFRKLRGTDYYKEP